MKYFALAVVALLAISASKPGTTRTKTNFFIHGYVRDSSSGAPIASASVDGVNMMWAMPFHATTDTSGYYYVSDSTSYGRGYWDVTASHPNYYSQMRTVYLPSQNQVNFTLTHTK